MVSRWVTKPTGTSGETQKGPLKLNFICGICFSRELFSGELCSNFKIFGDVALEGQCKMKSAYQ
ncbi:hypothetical protein FHS69_002399 [Erythrobacter flavus]|nr:hypothetical protein [Qipengyuania flava]